MLRIFSIAISLAAVSCSPAVSESEMLCRQNISSMMINPETTEFFEFDAISRDTAERAFADALLNSRDVKRSQRASYGYVIDQFDGLAKEAFDGLEASGAGYRSFRVKSESRVGMRVTSEFVCASSELQCSCFSESSIEQFMRN